MSRFLIGEQIYLRAASPADATPAYLSWINDPETTRGLVTGTYPSNLDSLRSYLESVSADGNSIMLAICLKSADQHIGNIKLDSFDKTAMTCELGIMIGDKDSWGKGIGSEVCRLVLNYAFEQLNQRKVSLTVYDNNPGAVRLYEKIGFQVEGRLRKHIYADGAYHDKLWMGIFKDELK